MAKIMQNLNRSTLATVVLVLHLVAETGCTTRRTDDKGAIRDTLPEFACCASADGARVFVVTERVLHQFEFRNEESAVATQYAAFKSPWQGRVLSIGFVNDSDLLAAIVFDVNAKHINPNNKHIDELERNAAYCFRVPNGDFTHAREVKRGFAELRFIDSSKMMYTTPSQRDFDGDCDVSHSAHIVDCALGSDGIEPDLSGPNSNNETVYCSSRSRMGFSTTSGLPFLTNEYGIATGKWDGEGKLTFVPLSLQPTPVQGGYDNAYGRYDFEYSVDASTDKRLLGIAISFPQSIRFSVWDMHNGDLVLDSFYPNNGDIGPSSPLRCFALGKTMFCVGGGRFIRVIDVEKESVQQVDVHQLTDEYRSGMVLSAKAAAGNLELCVVMTPFDKESVRRITVPLD